MGKTDRQTHSYITIDKVSCHIPFKTLKLKTKETHLYRYDKTIDLFEYFFKVDGSFPEPLYKQLSGKLKLKSTLQFINYNHPIWNDLRFDY